MVGLKSAFYGTFKFVLTLYFCEPLLIIVEEIRSMRNSNPICHGVFLTFVVMGGKGGGLRSVALVNKSSAFYEQNVIVRYLLTSLLL